MEILFLLAVFALLAVGCSKMSRWLTRLAAERQAQHREEQLHKEALAAAIGDIRDGVVLKEPTSLERLMQANQELVNKRRVREQVEDVLGEIEQNFGNSEEKFGS